MAHEVSVIIPTLNRRDLLVRAVASCVAQKNLRGEVIVVDDGSTDGTREAIEAGGFPRGDWEVRYEVQARQGACVARNRGLAAADGEFVKFLDSDDELLAGVLSEEVALARATGADVILTGWIEGVWNADAGRYERQSVVSAPRLDRGIDDMLDGRGPWTSAALYRRSCVHHLEWDPAWKKAQDWGWALRVCLAGARFETLDKPSAVYRHYRGDRISADPEAFLLSMRARQQLLRMVEDTLRDRNELTPSRRVQLAEYYGKDRRVLAEHDPGAWRAVWRHCRELSPGFRPREDRVVCRLLNRLLGVHAGVRTFVLARRLVTGRRGPGRTRGVA